jgi:hypothetical protein
MKQHFQKMLLCGILSMLAFSASAQKKEKEAEVPNLPIPEVIDFSTGKPIAKDELKETGKKGAQMSNLDYKNQISVGIINPLFGIADIGFERAITNNFSVELTGGITLPASSYWSGVDAFSSPGIAAARDLRVAYWANKGGVMSYSTLPTARQTIGATYNDVRSIKLVPGATGLAFGLNARYYLSNTEVFNGFYLGAHVQSLSLSYTTEKDSYTTPEPLVVKKSMTDIGILFGYTIFHRNHLNIGLEAIGGSRIMKHEGFDGAFITGSNKSEMEAVTYNYSGLVYFGTVRVGYIF